MQGDQDGSRVPVQGPGIFFNTCIQLDNMGGKSYSTDLRWRVIYLWWDKGKAKTETATDLCVSLSFVRKIKKLYLDSGNVKRQ